MAVCVRIYIMSTQMQIQCSLQDSHHNNIKTVAFYLRPIGTNGAESIAAYTCICI